MYVNDGRHIEIHTAEPLVCEPGSFQVKITVVKLIKYKAPDTDQILSVLIQNITF
jgi:hypothetical protein